MRPACFCGACDAASRWGCRTCGRCYLEAGETIDEFLQGFLNVSREQVIAFLGEAKMRMLAGVR